MRVTRYGRLIEEPGGMPLKEEIKLVNIRPGQYIVCATGDYDYFGVGNIVQAKQAFNINEQLLKFEQEVSAVRDLGWENRFWAWMHKRGVVSADIGDAVVMIHAADFGIQE